jgi:uncharacterized membrane protein
LNLPHVHLLLNHWPIIGTYIALALFFISLVSRSDDLRQFSLALFSIIALIAIPAYLSGNAAYDTIKKLPGFNKSLADTHEGAALLAFMAMEITGVIALIGMFRYSRAKSKDVMPPGVWTTPGILLFGVTTAVLMAIAGTTGGDIRHPEILSANATSSVGTMGASLLLSIRYFVIDYSRWVWPLLETLHFIGLILLLGTVGVLDLRIMGFLKQLPVGPLHRLLPWGIAGLGINVVTGFMFFVGMPFFYVFNEIFQAKMITILFAGGNLLLFHCTGAFRKWERLGPGEDAPSFAKLVALTSLLLWVTVVVIGRYIPLGESAG